MRVGVIILIAIVCTVVVVVVVVGVVVAVVAVVVAVVVFVIVAVVVVVAAVVFVLIVVVVVVWCTQKSQYIAQCVTPNNKLHYILSSYGEIQYLAFYACLRVCFCVLLSMLPYLDAFIHPVSPCPVGFARCGQ